MSDDIAIPTWKVQFANGEVTEFSETGNVPWTFPIVALKAASYHVKKKFPSEMGWVILSPCGHVNTFNLEQIDAEYKLFEPKNFKITN